MTANPSVDPDCLELAAHFLDESEIEATKTNAYSLAERIQQAIDDWFSERGANT